MSAFDKINKDSAELSELNKNIASELNNEYTGKYVGKNIRSNITGLNYYISDKGAIKYFAGPRSDLGNDGCPSDFLNIDEDLNSEEFRKENPYVFTGTNMVSMGEGENQRGQSCGAGINVFVDQLPPIDTSIVGCYTATASDLLGENLNYEQCKNLAVKENYPMFSLNTTILDNGVLYAGNNGTVSGDTYCQGNWGGNGQDKNMDCLYGIDSNGEKIPCSSGGVMMENNSFYCVPKINDNKPSEIGNCYGFKNLENITSYTGKPMQIKIVPISLSSCTFIDENKPLPIVTYAFTASGKFIALGNGFVYAYYWDSPTPECDFGGGVNLSTLKATYGGNCGTQCSIEEGNYTSTLLRTISSSNGGFSYDTFPKKEDFPEIYGDFFFDTLFPKSNFYVGTKVSHNDSTNVDTLTPLYGTDNDPCLGCSKDFVVSYQCGNNVASTINIPPSADGVAVNLDCGENITYCSSGIGISDDGDVKILRNIYGNVEEVFTINGPCPNKLIPVFSEFSDPQWLKMKDRLALNIEYNGKKYNLLKSPGYLSTSEYIISPAGTCAIVFNSPLPYILYYEEGITCNTMTGNYLGTQQTMNTPSLYGINQIASQLFIDNYGKRGYVDDDMVLHEYSSELNPTFIETPNNTISSGTFIGTTDYFSDERCKIECMKNDCKFISIDNDTCAYYKDQNGLTQSSGKVFEKIDPLNTLSDTCPFQDNYHSISTSTWENYVKSATPMTSETSCFREKNDYLTTQINRSNELATNIAKELELQTEETNNYIQTREKLNRSFVSNISKIKNMKEGFTLNLPKFNNIDKLYEESITLKTYNTSRIMLWTVVAIILIIMIVYR